MFLPQRAAAEEATDALHRVLVHAAARKVHLLIGAGEQIWCVCFKLCLGAFVSTKGL